LISPAPNISRNASQRKQRRQEDRQKADLEQQDFPAERVKRLADVNQRQVERPEHGEHRRVAQTNGHEHAEHHAERGATEHEAVGVVEPEQRRQTPSCRRSEPVTHVAE
jgi:hypothetical protein